MSDLPVQWAQAWWLWMGAMFWQASLLIGVVAIVDLATRRFLWPQVRYALWSLVLLKLVLPPTWSAPSGIVTQLQPWLGREVVARIAGPSPQDATSGVPSESTDAKAREGATSAGGASVTAGTPAEADRSWAVLAGAVWLSGILALAALLWVRIATLRRWHRQQKTRGVIPPWFHELLVATAGRIGLERLPAIVFSDRAVSPAVYGVLRPTLLLPARYLDSLGRTEAEHVLLHELAHIRRGDLWVNALWLVLQGVYWFNPLVALARREAKHVREMCCDLTVASLLQERTAGYRATLLNTARELLTESIEPGMGLLGVFEEPFRLVPRLRLLEHDSWRHRRLATAAAIAAPLLLAPFLLPMAAARPVSPRGDDLRREESTRRAEAVLADASAGDIFIREVVREEILVLGLPLRARIVGTNSAWFGDGVLAVNERGHTAVLDRARDRLVVIDHDARTYVEADLSAEPEAMIAPALQARFDERRTTGTVDDTGRTRTVLGYRCREYTVAIWRVWGRNAGAPSTLTVWTTTQAPVDLALFDQFLEIWRRLGNRDRDLRHALRTARGIQLRTEMVVEDGYLAQRRYVGQAEEIVRRPAPAGAYEAPPGYRRLDRLESIDF